MIKSKLTILAFLLIISLGACSSADSSKEKMKPAKVEVKQVDGKWRFVVNGEEFFIKGAGCEYGPCHEVALRGGNSFRTWTTDNDLMTALEVLDLAHENGLMVMMGLPVVNERYGFDYDDEEAVKAQLEELKQEVLKLKDHPALLGWGIGNELNLGSSNLKVWDAVEEIAKMIKEVDGNHPTTTMLAGIAKREVDYIRENCPSIDFLSLQVYGSLIRLDERIYNAGYEGPYIVSEWGSTGHWEVDTTEWGSPIEHTSSERVDGIIERYNKSIIGDSINCMGSYVFLWGQKQERTPTWYSIYTEQGEKTEINSVMEYLWTGEWPEYTPPRLNDIYIKGIGGRFDNVKLKAGNKYSASIDVESNVESLSLRVEILPEATELGFGGSYEPRPESIENLLITEGVIDDIRFETPLESGPYRLFVYVLDGKGYAAYANLPFFVEE